jgi:GNAT superfamily N-acetyltransferase
MGERDERAGADGCHRAGGARASSPDAACEGEPGRERRRGRWDAAVRIATAFAAAAEMREAAGERAVVAGVTCLSLPLPFPWATQARPMAGGVPPPAPVLAEVVGWLAARAPQWTILVRVEHSAALPGFAVAERMPVLALDGPVPVSAPPGGVEIGVARDPTEFLSVYGPDLASLVTARHFAAPEHHHLVARVDGAPVGCARVHADDGTARVSGVSVLPAYRRRGIGAALSAAAGRVGAAHADLVWLHATDRSRSIYERLGFAEVDEHVQLVQENSAK